MCKSQEFCDMPSRSRLGIEPGPCNSLELENPLLREVSAVSAESIAMLRIGQLLITSLLGFGSIFLGYRLFSQIPVTTTADGQFKMPNIGEAKLKAGPGLFFALFGAIAIYFSIDRAITISNTPDSSFSFANAPPSFQYSCQRRQ